MKKIVVWRGRSQARILAIDRETAMDILRAIGEYLTAGAGNVKKLRPPRRELRLRVGDYRVFFVSRGPRSVDVLAVRHRSEAYRLNGPGRKKVCPPTC